MKRQFFRILFAVAATATLAALAACQKEPPAGQTGGQTPPSGQQNTLSVNIGQITFDASDTTPKSVTVTTDAASWTATPSADWLTVEKDEDGTTLHVAVAALNMGTADLTGEIVFSAGDAPDVRLPVRQLPTPLTDEFDIFGLFFYYGNAFRNGTANFVLNCFNSDNVGINIEGFCDFPENGYAGFSFTEGRYTVGESCELMTLLPGVTPLSTLGTYIYKGVAPNLEEIIITGGSMTITRSGASSYTILTDFSGYELKNKSNTFDHLCYRFSGRIDFNDAERTRDYSADITADKLTGAYGAKGVGAYNNPSNNTFSRWTGSIAADGSVENRFVFASGEEGMDHWCRLEQNELLLEADTPVAQRTVDGTPVDVYIRAFAIADGRIFWVYKNAPGYGLDYPLRYRRDVGILMFKERVTFDDGVARDVLIGAVGVDAAGEIYVMSECYRDLEYEVESLGGAPVSRVPAAATRNSVATAHEKGAAQTALGLSEGHMFRTLK